MASKHLKAWLVSNANLSATASDKEVREATSAALSNKTISGKQVGELLDETDEDGKLMDRGKGTSNPTFDKVFGGAAHSGQPDVKAASARYKDVRYTAKHARTGAPVKSPSGREVETLSERDLARMGAFIKLAAKKGGIPVEQSDHEKELVEEMFHTDIWAGEINGSYHKDISGLRVKASLLEDTNSGGLYMSPLFFDEAIITFPLLYGELMPFVDLVDLPRGSEVRTASLENPSVTWGQAEGTSLTEFDSTALIAQLTSEVNDVMYATEIGRDMLSDSAVTDLGARVVETVGASMLREMDKVIAIGNGTTQPQGIVNQSSPVNVNSNNGVGGPMNLSDYEALMFTVPKQYRTPQNRCCFIGNDSSYYRARAVPVGTNDARRVFGQDEGSYNILSWPWRVQQDIPDNQVMYGALAKYRLYRRQGQEVRMSDVGQSLMLKNTTLIVVRGRWAGRVIDSNAFAYMNDAATL